MIGGIKPVKIDKNDYDFHATFGSVTVSSLSEEYDCDLGKTMPDQDIPGLGVPEFIGIPPMPMGCTALTQSEVGGDEDGEVYDPQFVYDKTLLIEGNEGNYNAPCDIRNSFKALTIYGLKKRGESDAQALKNIRAPYFNVRPTTDAFEGIRSCLHLNRFKKRPVSIGIPWFREFQQVCPDGIVPLTYSGDPYAMGWHNVKCSGWVMRKGEPMLKIKSWQGPNVGDKGWLYFRRETINSLLAIRYTGAFATKRAAPEDIKRVQLTIVEQILYYFNRILSQLSTQS